MSLSCSDYQPCPTPPLAPLPVSFPPGIFPSQNERESSETTPLSCTRNSAKSGPKRRHKCSSTAATRYVAPPTTTLSSSPLFQWGVGNWKAILKDPKLKFDNRSPVDLKDRSVSSSPSSPVTHSHTPHSFRTYFPDAYKEHYPNAKTHLSSKVRSTLPDGRSIFEKTRSKKRRPFTEEEDRALKAGYEKHGTVWATIVKDPIFQEQNRRSTDLRDRFRNAFPELYQAAGYKPRNAPKKKHLPVRAATDDQLPSTTSHIGPTRQKRASRILRGGTKSVPESATCSEDDDSSAAEEESARRLFKCPPITTDACPQDEAPSSAEPFPEMDMETIDPLSEPLSIPDFMPSATHSLSELTDSSQSQGTWSSIDTPIHSSSWSANTGSPTSSHLSSSDYPFNQSPFMRRMSTIGKSPWGAQDWFSANPRLDTSTFSSSGSSFADGLSPAPSSPFSFHHLNHGVMDRYDLFPTTFHDFASEAGVGDTHSTFSDPEMFPTSTFRGFTHHSNYAGDLIFGARTHQPQQSYYGPGFGFGTPGLGLSGMQQPSGMHSMQIPALPGIDEIELASITLNDQADVPASVSAAGEIGIQKDDAETSLNIASTLELFAIAPHNMEDMVDLAHSTPPATPLTTSRPMRLHHIHSSASHGRSISVPPSEPRSTMTRSTQVQAHSQPVITTTRSLPFFDALPHHTSESVAPLHATVDAQSGVDLWKPSTSDFHNLPFLDLHYYSGSHSADGHHDGATDTSRQGQALDLARSNMSLRSAPPTAPYSSVTQALQTAQALLVETAQEVGTSVGTGARQSHQRGMSFVSPQDLQLRKASDNKRKRASWDGGAF